MPWWKCAKFLKPFYCSRYVPDSSGAIRPSTPEFCPLAQSGAGGPCQIQTADWRQRKCGPGFPLLVLRCLTHKISFTVYPIGWVPFGRRELLETIEAVQDKASGESWPDQAYGSKPTRKTQARWIFALSLLTGIDPSLDENSIHLSGVVLNVATTVLKGFSERIRDGPPTPKRRAEAIRDLLNHIANHEALFKQGSQIGFWGPAQSL